MARQGRIFYFYLTFKSLIDINIEDEEEIKMRRDGIITTLIIIIKTVIITMIKVCHHIHHLPIHHRSFDNMTPTDLHTNNSRRSEL